VNEPVVQQALRDSVDEVLDKMFFVQALGESPDPGLAAMEPPAAIAVRLTFLGEPSGSLALRLTSTAARSIAADFLGTDEEEVSDPRMADVVCELANMICGSLLSRVENAATFQLAAPRIVPLSEGPAQEPGATFYAVDLPKGSLAVSVNTGTPPCPAPIQSVS
jgi:CheY-specific phosphatase CheX